MVSIRVENLTKRFGKVVAVDHISFEVKEGEFVCLLGPSGCGKTTTLRMIAGLEYPDEGRVYFDEKDVTDIPPWKRNVGFVFQKMSVFPHMTIYKNIEWALKLRKWPKDQIKSRIKEVLELVKLTGLEDRYVSQLSGGQAQRVVIARALAPDPDVLLLDEPLSMLDAKLRDELKNDLKEIHEETLKTTIMVTHDQSEAFSVADRVLVMNEGKIVQSGTPIEIYNNPQDPFVVEFIGSNNFLRGKVADVIANKEITIMTESGNILKKEYIPGYVKGEEVMICIRADDIDVISREEMSKYKTVLEGTISRSIFVGPYVVLDVSFDEKETLRVHLMGSDKFKYIKNKGEKVLLGINNFIIFRR
ncbi:MAG: polyamine ABC transporter ATP-binding protein [Thermoprotei archaeon]|nr:MAG: polyamine ABC transporter ATP-binding protein [Thermoprotei archaeon]